MSKIIATSTSGGVSVDSKIFVGAANGTDVSGTTAIASDVALGKFFYTADGTRTQGSAIFNPVIPTETKTVTLGSSAPTTITPTTGYHLSSVALEIDDTVIKAENIAKDAQILGITGTYIGGIQVSGTKAITDTSAVDVATFEKAQVVDSQLKSENIISGKTILGIAGSAVVPSGTKTVQSSATQQTNIDITNYSSLTIEPIAESTLTNDIISGSVILESSSDSDYMWRTSVVIPAGYHSEQTLIKDFENIFAAPSNEGSESYLLEGYQLFDHTGTLLTGSMTNNIATSTILSNQDEVYTIPEGYHDGTGTVTASLPDGSLQLSCSQSMAGSASMEADGFTPSASATSQFIKLTTTAGKATGMVDIVTEGLFDSTDSDATDPVDIEVTGNNTYIYIPDGAYTASCTQTQAGSASISATGFTPSSSATSYYVRLTTSAGQATGTANISSAGFLSTGSVSSATPTSIAVTGNDTYIYIPVYTGTVS